MAVSQNTRSHHMRAVTATSSRQLISEARPGRTIIVQNQGSATVYIGGSDVSPTLGIMVDLNAKTFVDGSTGAEYWIVCATSSDVIVDEIY